jgi:hypothetical protein
MARRPARQHADYSTIASAVFNRSTSENNIRNGTTVRLFGNHNTDSESTHTSWRDQAYLSFPSSDPQENVGCSLEGQDKMSNGHIFVYKDVEQTTIPVGGIPCFSETNGVWTGPSHALLHFLNDPILSRLDNNGQNIIFNTVYECYIDRVGRDLTAFDIIETTFRERGVSIWCLHEQIGSVTHLDDFRGRIQIAEDFSTLLSSKVKRGRNVKGLLNCSPHEPTSEGDGWGPLEDIRLIQFKFPHTNIPPQYYRPATTRAKAKIKWEILRKEEFPLRTAEQIRDRVRTLSIHGLRIP